MPGRNLEKIYVDNAYYHVYNRGVNKGLVFRDGEDYAVLLNLFKRYLDERPTKDNKGREYDWLHDDIELLAFCLMPNHFHALIYQYNELAMTRLFKAVTTTYGMYFNKKYRRVGPVFQGRFRASMITTDTYLQHISRYIHLNPQEYKKWEFSSLPYYLNRKSAAWVQPGKIMSLFGDSPTKYAQFVADYEDYRHTLDSVEAELA